MNDITFTGILGEMREESQHEVQEINAWKLDLTDNLTGEVVTLRKNCATLHSKLYINYSKL